MSKLINFVVRSFALETQPKEIKRGVDLRVSVGYDDGGFVGAF